MAERNDGYCVVTSYRTHPDNYQGPLFVRRVLSFLSKRNEINFGNLVNGMNRYEAERVAKNQTNLDGYVDENGALKFSNGKVKKETHLLGLNLD
jgi:hypothetical protein